MTNESAMPMLTMLRWEVEIIKPHVIMTIGGYANYAYFQNVDINTIQGQVWRKQGRIVIPMYSPSYVIAHPKLKTAYIRSVRRCLREAFAEDATLQESRWD